MYFCVPPSSSSSAMLARRGCLLATGISVQSLHITSTTLSSSSGSFWLYTVLSKLMY